MSVVTVKIHADHLDVNNISPLYRHYSTATEN